MRLLVADGIPAGIVDVRLQLAPGQDESGLIVEFPLTSDAAPLLVLARRGAAVAQVSEKPVDPFIRRHDELKVAHRRVRLNHSRVTDSRLRRRSSRATRQSGSPKFSAASTMR